MHHRLPFSLRYRKPFWLLLCPDTGRTAVYGVYGDLMADAASDEFVSFALAHFAEITLWKDIGGPSRPRQLASWMTPEGKDRCFLFALRTMDTPTSIIAATPDR